MKLNKSNCYKKDILGIEKSKGVFTPKIILTVIDEMSEVMETNNYKAQGSISDSIASIARLGRAGAVQLVLAALPEYEEVEIIRSKSLSLYYLNKHLDDLKIEIGNRSTNLNIKNNLPNYFKNMTNDYIADYKNYIKNLITIPNTYKKEGRFNLKWKDLQIGDIIDDSVITYITPWNKEKCYRLICEDESQIDASLTHLFKANIFNNGKKINNNLDLSRDIRKSVNETNEDWVCVGDIYNSIISELEVFLSDGTKIIECKDIGEQNVRCIQTTKGEYSIKR